MKVLYFKWNSFGTEDIEEAIREPGHELIIKSWSQDDVDRCIELIKKAGDLITEEKPDFVVGSQQTMYGRLTGTYEVQSEEGTENYPSFDLLFWD